MNVNKVSVRFWAEDGSMCSMEYDEGTNKEIIEKDFEEFKNERREKLLKSLDNMNWDFGFEEDTIINPESNSGMTCKKVNRFYDSEKYKKK
jgi:hypothetical protein